jgi:hypothetical protein
LLSGIKIWPDWRQKVATARCSVQRRGQS